MNTADEVNILMEQLATEWGSVVVVCDGKLCQVIGGVGVIYQASTLVEALRLAANPISTCRVCGCTDDHACEGGCWWVEADLCSTCAAAMVAGPVMEMEPEPIMATITGLIEEVKVRGRGVHGLNHQFTNLEIAGSAYNGKLVLRRTFDHDYAWGVFARLYDANDKEWMLDAYEDDPAVALDLLKEKMFQWAREREAEATL